MASGSGKLLELRLESNGLSGRIAYPPGLRPLPGQYLVASGADPSEPLPVTLFPSRIDRDEMVLAAPLPVSWTAGMSLQLRGPLGTEFRMPGTTRRLALASLDGNPARLLPLADLAMTQGAAVAIYASFTPDGLPEEVEVLPLDLLPEAAAWADFLAMEANLIDLPNLRTRLGLKPFQNPACQTQVMITTAMPCSGLAECGVCAVAVRKGWALACEDGPVFDFLELEGI